MQFELQHNDPRSNARAGLITTDHGTIETPVFMPVGTMGTVRGIHQQQLKEDIGAQIILGNTYHLYLRPGLEVIEQAGGLHQFNGWHLPILTDSGGYQVYSLAEKRKITQDGVEFQSHIDGSSHFFSPEKTINIQRSIGADIIMAFDECPPYPCDYEYAKKSMELTQQWLKRCVDHFANTSPLYDFSQALFPIVQGSVYDDLRKHSTESVANLDMAGNAIGGLSVGEPEEEMYKMTGLTCEILPPNKPRYLMGVGTPANILECISLGVDMFDCVMPTRNGRNGWLFTKEGIINIKNEKWKHDYSPIDSANITFVDSNYSKAYLRHLILSNEMLGAQIASMHNLGFYAWLMKTAREKIASGNFSSWKSELIPKLKARN